MASRKRSSRKRSRGGARWLWGVLQLVIVAVGAVVVAVYVSRWLPPSSAPEAPSRQQVTSQPQRPVRRAPSETVPTPRSSAVPQRPPEAVQQPEEVPPPSRASETMPPDAPLQVTSREVTAGSSTEKLVALTFDAGSSAHPVPAILQALAQHNVRSTFFLTGQWIERHPEAARQIVEAGHELGNHSWSHPPFTSLSSEQIREQLRRTEEIAMRVCGRTTKPLFRPPFGDRDERVRQVVAEEGYLTIYWTIDSWDSVKKDITPQEIFQRVMRRVRPGAIVLMHCGSEATAQALPQLLQALEAQGYRAVTVSELLRSSPQYSLAPSR